MFSLGSNQTAERRKAPLPRLVPVPAGEWRGARIEDFLLGETPVTNAQYEAHVNRHRDRPFVLMELSEDGAAAVVARRKSPAELAGDGLPRVPDLWDTRVVYACGAFRCFELRADLSPGFFDAPAQPVVNVSWFHAMEYCLANGYVLPTDEQWAYAAHGPRGHDFATRSGQLAGNEAHFSRRATARVGLYGPNDYGLYDMTGNVWEWTARNPSERWPYGLRGGSWRNTRPSSLRADYRYYNHPSYGANYIGFRVAEVCGTGSNAPGI